MKKLYAIIFCILFLNITAFANAKDDLLNGYFGIPTYNDVNFNDLDEASWAKEPIQYLAKYGIVSGYDDDFYPMNNVTRAEFIKILVLSYGAYDNTATSNFADSTPSDWHYPYISTAKKLGITNGVDDNNFGVQMPLKREEMVTLAYKMARFAGNTFDETQTAKFEDMGEISSYAVKAVNAMKQKGIIAGDLNNCFNPNALATRAEACKIIYLLLNL